MIRDIFARHANNFRGQCIDRKVIVIESDDWGSVCMPSRKIYNGLLKEGFKVNDDPYATYDSLASVQDLTALFSVLREFRDINGRHPIITANTLTANPDFRKIKKSDFTEYYYEIFTETLQRYPNKTHGNAFEVWENGMEENLFYPQFHGREHINPNIWFNLLHELDPAYRKVFDREVSWLGPFYDDDKYGCLRASFEAKKYLEVELHKGIIQEGLDIFQRIFGYRSASFIAPNYVYHPRLNSILMEGGVRFIQGMKYQKLPKLGKQKREMVRHFQGGQNKLGQTYLVRNCSFEPSLKPKSYDNVGECLKGISNAFLWKKPAIISSHRLNFIGYIHPENRKNNLKLFRELLHQIILRWPSVEFKTSVELGRLLDSSK